jgi:hypothetical protein
MPGLMGVVGAAARQDMASSAADSISHFDGYVRDCCSPFSGVEIAQVWRSEGEIAGSWHRHSPTGITAFVNGTAITSGARPSVLLAADILAAHLDGTLAPETYDGSFVVVIADPGTKELILFNDRLGKLPCYYFSDANCFCFAPESKAIFAALDRAPEFSREGLISFLTIGYCLADTTLFESIKFLEPGTRLRINAVSNKVEQNRYWRLHYKPAPELRSRRHAEDAMYQAIVDGHKAVFANDEEKYDVLLSGGWDSRGMLAAANELGRMPRRAVSWGRRGDIPRSDPYLAAQLAEQFGVSHHFIRYDTDSFVQNALDWSFVTELNTDNFGWYGEGVPVLLHEYAHGADYVLAGDECWGWGGHVRNYVEAVAACNMPSPFPMTVRKALSPALASDVDVLYSNEINKVFRSCDNANDVDRKDFLYAHGRVARFIFSLGYYKELAVEVRRPFLSNTVLDLMQQIPARFRYGKNLYISTLITHFPEVLKVAKRSASGLPRWRDDLRTKPDLSRYFAELLSSRSLEQTTFAEHLDLDHIGTISSEFFSTPQAKRHNPDRGANLGPFAQSIRQRYAALDDVRVALHLKRPAEQQCSNFDLLRRIALLALLDRNLPRFSRPTTG